MQSEPHFAARPKPLIFRGFDASGTGLMGLDPSEWAKKVEVDTGQRGGITTEQAEKMKALEREVRELKQANEILRKASAYFAPPLGTLRRKALPGSGTELDRQFRK